MQLSGKNEATQEEAEDEDAEHDAEEGSQDDMHEDLKDEDDDQGELDLVMGEATDDECPGEDEADLEHKDEGDDWKGWTQDDYDDAAESAGHRPLHPNTHVPVSNPSDSSPK